MLTPRRSAPRDLHVSWAARDRYQFDESLFTLQGTVVFANFHGARVFAQKMNQKRDLVNYPEQAVRASQINALGLIHELTHVIFDQYCEQNAPTLLQDMLASANQQLGAATVDSTLRKFVEDFPPVPVYRREIEPQAYLAGATDGTPNRELIIEEMIMLWVSNANPAFTPFQELFDDTVLKKETSYSQVVTNAQTVTSGAEAGEAGGTAAATARLAGIAGGVLGNQGLLDLLLAPARAHPHSLEAQLEYMRTSWGTVLGRQVYRLLGSLDLIKEEEKPMFFGGDGGPGPIPIPVYGGVSDVESENFTQDREWMPRLVMVAKNAYVWLDQLSKKYSRPVHSLADIPDEELDEMARWGYTGLWLIGLWERSRASKEIKQIMGNTDAVASAYSLYDYQIAAALGGEAACNSLRERAWQRGIRLASDMVPNHVGVDGRWVVENPDRFISLDYPPYPSYTFNGPDLSQDDRVGIFLEDHYYERSDAAVVFKRVDRHSGDERYVYHGNDGTSMAWNDTAQLNYLNPEVREAVIQTILEVARQFPIIRFDAAMTLAKRHYHRLWFPEPGTGGDIASRADFGMTRAEFDKLMPQEFWREVVDRAAVEAPDTLLLAEAFWMMESYFVRTLGMHRVYNSAFMHILRDEENAKYRMLMKNTLEFDPEILKRYVNFMNNPDEKTAVEQFGKGDKYFGVCTLLVTLPGLPMLGHGQVEGYAEKYGMEYQRAYFNETPDQYLIERHEREIFPLIHKRYLFANVDHFLLYDFFAPDGSVNENVFAYSNGHGDERALVLYHNRDGNASGWVRSSAAYSVRDGDERTLTQQTLGEGLGLHADDNRFCIFRDHSANMEFIRSSKELIERGLYVELGAYKYQVFLDFREVRSDETNRYADLAAYLDGRGVPSVEDAMQEIFLGPIHQPLRALVNADVFRRLAAARLVSDGTEAFTASDDDVIDPDLAEARLLDEVGELAASDELAAEDVALLDDIAPELEQARALDDQASTDLELADEVERKMTALLDAITAFIGSDADVAPVARAARAELEVVLQHRLLGQRFADMDAPGYRAAIAMLNAWLDSDDPAVWGTVWSWLFVHNLGMLAGGDDFALQGESWIDEWMLGRVIDPAVRDYGVDAQAASRTVLRVKRLVGQQRWYEDSDLNEPRQVLESMLQDSVIRQFLQVNRAQSVLWFNKEGFENVLWWMLFAAVVTISADPKRTPVDVTRDIGAAYAVVQQLQRASDRSDYKVDKLLELVSEAPVAAK